MGLTKKAALMCEQREADVRRLLAERQMTIQEISKQSGISHTSCRNLIWRLRKERVVYVSGWVLEGHSKIAVHALGDCPDAKYVKQTTEDKSRKHAEWRKRVGSRERVIDAAKMAEKDIRRIHEDRMANWVPRADIAAAWMFCEINQDGREAA